MAAAFQPVLDLIREEHGNYYFGTFEPRSLPRIGTSERSYVVSTRVNDTDVAAKVVEIKPPNKVKKAEMFRREFITYLRLPDHPNLVHFFGAARSPRNELVIIMELLDWSLRDTWDREVHFELEPINFLADTGAGLCHLHNQGIIHRSLKPDNILIDGNGRAKISDVTLSHVSMDGDILRYKAQADRELYVAPEVRHCPLLITSAYDIYALGSICLYTLLRKQPAPRARPRFRGGMLLDEEIRRRKDFEDLGQHPLRELIIHCLSLEHLHRPCTSEVHTRLNHALEQLKYDNTHMFKQEWKRIHKVRRLTR